MKTDNQQDNKTPLPKLLVIGYARHGKDTVCEILRDKYGYKFVSSSYFAAEKVVFPAIKDKYGYETVEQCYEDRHNHRGEWFTLIADYNKDDLSRLAKELLVEHDVYCGMRNRYEAAKCRDEKLFDHVVWVDAHLRGIPPEGPDSCTVCKHDANYIITNNGTVEQLEKAIDQMHNYFITGIYVEQE